ncbi:MAG: hypothetical protein KKE02_10350 [Alphaproteobacteria bacterium]|nr:hypothetical protein [Alphaproteobacteria bacterium]MBU1515834.1 hypothetical protein [Alphaproteobacteria bacterium]MBU2094056.1 hypothetical protein [Alphaproteobacteria bacterium]MBU2151408.1 hypothetical protein [Alphaproteobacteria bacterium]MBU2305316.1 hypothetical protein [Alphaproteobacteria bacterium]
MSQIAAFADEDTRRTMKVLSADVQASLALNRALLQALATLSPALNAAAERALEGEIDQALRQSAPQRVVDLIEDARELMQDTPAEVEMMSALERALIAAADALPDITDLEAAETASLARG